MIKKKKSIRENILFSQMIVFLISLIFIMIISNICLKLFVKKQIQSEITTAGELSLKSIANNTLDIGNLQENNSKKQIINDLKGFNINLSQSKLSIKIKFALLGKNKNLLYPSNPTNAEYRLINNKLLPSINSKPLLSNKYGKGQVFNFTSANKKYEAIIYPIKASSNPNVSYLFIYVDLSQSNRLILIFDFALLSILFVTFVIGFIIFSNVSDRILRPISDLNKFAQKIGERNYEPEHIEYNDDELGKLADTMNSMAEKLAAYDSTMKSFLQNASHELRTPLMSIQGYAEGIKYGVVDEEDKALNIIIDESKRLSTLVEDILYLSKIDSFQEEFSNEEINIDYLIKSSIERVKGIAVTENKKILYNTSEKEVFIHGDEEKFMRAIINILGNCLRYSNNVVNITLSKSADKVIISIYDDGPGFDECDLPNIFNRFYKGKGGKHGLGLTIAKSIIEKQNGKISARNRNCGGAYFEIELESNT